MGTNALSVWVPALGITWSAGHRALYRLAERLNCPLNVPAETTIYPETCVGNPLGGKRVIHWILNSIGYNGGPKSFPPEDLLFAFCPEQGLDYPVLYIDVIEREWFRDPGVVNRSGAYFWVGKGQQPQRRQVRGMREITKSWPATRPELAHLLQHAAELRTFDGMTALVAEAKLCGCPVTGDLDHQWPFPPGDNLTALLNFT